MNFGYARVSAKDQHLDTQLGQLQAAGVDRIFHEKISGTTTQRPVLTELLATLRAGDTVTVARLNRLGRNSAHARPHLLFQLRYETRPTCSYQDFYLP